MVIIKNRWITPNVSENMEQPEFSYTAGESINGATILIKGLAISCKIEYTPPYLWLSNSNYRCINKRNGVHMFIKIVVQKCS